LLRAANVSLRSVGLVNVHIADRASRAMIDPAWLKLYPDGPRPARKTNEVALPAGLHVMLQAIAVRDAAIVELAIPGLSHRSPIPMGTLAGPLVFSSVLDGSDPATGQIVSDPQQQIRQAFRNVDALMRAAGGDAGGVNHMWAFARSASDAESMLRAYLETFPDEHNRPARKTVMYPLPEGLSLQLQISGSIAGRSGNFEVPGVKHHDPIPMASRAGGLFQSSGIHGIDPATSAMTPRGLAHEVQLSLDSMEAVLRNAAGTLDSIAGLTVLLRDLSAVQSVYALVESRFANGRIPALQFLNLPLPTGMNVQFHITGWLGNSKASV
jgi:2-iminobutanoate/2-iminopropanoate deaminase